MQTKYLIWLCLLLTLSLAGLLVLRSKAHRIPIDDSESVNHAPLASLSNQAEPQSDATLNKPDSTQVEALHEQIVQQEELIENDQVSDDELSPPRYCFGNLILGDEIEDFRDLFPALEENAILCWVSPTEIGKLNLTAYYEEEDGGLTARRVGVTATNMQLVSKYVRLMLDASELEGMLATELAQDEGRPAFEDRNKAWMTGASMKGGCRIVERDSRFVAIPTQELKQDQGLLEINEAMKEILVELLGTNLYTITWNITELK